MKGGGAQGFSQVVQIFIRLAEVPLLLSFWGTQLYGEWLMLSAIPAYLSIGDGGFAGAACRDMTMRSGSGDRNGQLITFQSTWVLLIIISIVTGLLTAVFVQIAPIVNWLDFSSMTAYEIKICLILLVAHVLIGFQSGLLNSGFWVKGQYSSSMYFTAVIQLLEFVSFAIAIVLGGGPVHAATGLLVGRVLGIILMWIGQRIVSPWLKYGVSCTSFSDLKRIALPALASLAFPLGNALNIQGTRLVVGLVLGPSALSLFVPLRTLSRLVMQPAAIINRLIEPELALSYGAENKALFKRLFASSCQLTLWGCLGACFLFGPAAHWIFPIWTGSVVSMDWPTYLSLLCGVILNSIWYTALMVPYAINRHGGIAPSYLIFYGAVAVGLSYMGASSLDLFGVAFALLLTEATMAIIILNASLRMTGVRLAQWAVIVLHPPFGTFAKALQNKPK